MNEDVVVSETERWASAYYISYMSFRSKRTMRDSIEKSVHIAESLNSQQ